jgi:PleD family two-component response regulator
LAATTSPRLLVTNAAASVIDECRVVEQLRRRDESGAAYIQIVVVQERDDGVEYRRARSSEGDDGRILIHHEAMLAGEPRGLVADVIRQVAEPVEQYRA